MSQAFGIDEPIPALNDFQEKVRQFRSDALNKELACDCAIAAWHICDIVFVKTSVKSVFRSLTTFQEKVRTECLDLGYLQDIAIARKHGEISRYTPRVKTASEKGGAFSQAFSRDFDISLLVIVTEDGNEHAMLDVLARVLAYWEQFFQKHGIN